MWRAMYDQTTPLWGDLTNGGIGCGTSLLTLQSQTCGSSTRRHCLHSSKHILNHFQFVISMCKALTKNWEGQRLCTSVLVDKMPKIHCPMKSHLRHVCVHCKKCTNAFCAPCNFQWMCYTCGCFLKMHRAHGACA